MLKISIFCLIIYTISFAIVYKKPIVAKPYEWIMTIFGLKESLNCSLCTPLWIGAIGSLMNVFILPEYDLAPSLVLFGMPDTWIEYVAGTVIDAFSVASIVYLIDQFNSYFLEYRGKLDVTLNQKTDLKQILHD